MIGTEKTSYSIAKLRELVNTGQIDEAKQYIRKYLVKISNPAGYLAWVPSENKFEVHLMKDLKTVHIMPGISAPYVVNGKIEKFSPLKWFLEENDDVYRQSNDVTQPREYEQCGQKYINLFPGYMHQEVKKYDDFSDEIKEGVEFVWNHIQEVWCSNKEVSFQYVKKWIINMVAGRKMQTCLYLKSEQGTGKSSITEFLMYKVLGKNIVHTTNDPSCVSGGWNSELVGKVLLVLEEMPTASEHEWRSLANSIKHYITGKDFVVKEKMVREYVIANFLSMIINSNNNALPIPPDERRIFALDVSNKRVGDVRHFKKLHKYTNRDDVGEAFYWHCKENADPIFKEFAEMPVTTTKTDLIADHLHSLYKYIKDIFVLQHFGIDMKFSKFYEDYVAYCDLKKLKADTKISLSKKLTDLTVPMVAKTNNVKYIEISKADLLAIYNKKHWIHDTDDFEQPIEKKPKKKNKSKDKKEQKHKKEKKNKALLDDDNTDSDNDDKRANKVMNMFK